MKEDFKFVLYQSDEGDVAVNAAIKDESIWLTQKGMAELFGVDRTSISRHLGNIFKEGELDEQVVRAKIAQTTQHGAMPDKTQTKETFFYNLDAIISVGYRVNSRRATKFRRYDILRDKGRISSRQAKEKAEAEYVEFNKTQKITSDFDREVQRMMQSKMNDSNNERGADRNAG